MMKTFRCYDCDYEWNIPCRVGINSEQMHCPQCGSILIWSVKSRRHLGYLSFAAKWGKGRGRTHTRRNCYEHVQRD